MSITRNIIKPNFYRDSIQMMLLTQELKKEEGVLDVAIVMGTQSNKETLLRCGLLTNDGTKAEEGDIIISLNCKDEVSLAGAIKKAETLLTQTHYQSKTDFSNVDEALASFENANLAMLSIPGKYVKPVATKLIDKGLHILLFSNHVPLEDEIDLKRRATDKDVLFMGPEAGTSIINGKVLGFGNRLRHGNIGIIGASGTGIQESSTLLHFCGSGVSHAIGVGGRDMHKQVGGLMTFQAISLFEDDPNTKSILMVSKPVEKEMRDKIIDRILDVSKKRYVLCLLGDKSNLQDRPQLNFAKSIQAAVLKLLRTLDEAKYRTTVKKFRYEAQSTIKFAKALSSSLDPRQKYVRGFFVGGTLCYEASVILEDMVGRVNSNLGSDQEYHVDGKEKSNQHTLIDFGKEEFTATRPHPIIYPSPRLNRLLEEANDPLVAVIIMDIIAGYSVPDRNIEQHAEIIEKAIAIAGRQDRTLPIFTYICGTTDDVLKSEVAMLRDSGAQVFTSNALMSVAAGLVASKKNLSKNKLNMIVSNYLGDEI